MEPFGRFGEVLQGKREGNGGGGAAAFPNNELLNLGHGTVKSRATKTSTMVLERAWGVNGL